MTIQDAAGWAAPVATAAAAVMTASNLGPRMTGWGFVVFVFGSVGWCIVALQTGQTNLLWANGFFTLVNLAGVWRWLGRQARYQRASAEASAASRRSDAPDLVSVNALIGARVTGLGEETLGHVVEAMLRRDRSSLAYLVISTGGLAGVGETLHALETRELVLTDDGVKCGLTGEEMRRRAALPPGRWPASARRLDVVEQT